jgi:UDP-N-acetylmuramoyl-tripeptide--D-alanyl-D-alanine ligase
MRRTLLATLGTSLSIHDVKIATDGSLASGHSGVSVTGVSIDSRTVSPGELFVAIAGKHFDGHDFVGEAAGRGAVAALVHRDVPGGEGLTVVRVADTTQALGDLARHVRLAAALPVVCVTGSTGKTTTKDMTAALLGSRGPVLKTEGNLNNQYGLPLTMMRLGAAHWSAVLELGMSAPGELRALSAIAQPDVAVITNVGPAHLGFFPSVDAIADAKAEILEGLRPGGVAVLNADDPRVRRIGEASGRDVIWFGRDRRHDVSAENWRGSIAGMRFDLRLGGRSVDIALPLAGPHHVMNFMAAAAVAHRLGITPEAIAIAAAGIEPPLHRGQVLRCGESVTIVDDSYNASPDAVAAAMTTLGLAAGRRVLFLGDMLELGDASAGLHREVGEKLAGRVDAVVGVGPMAKHVVEAARASGMDESALHHFADSETAAAAAADLARPGDTILVKGSRGMRMERVLDALVARFGTKDGRTSAHDSH